MSAPLNRRRFLKYAATAAAAGAVAACGGAPPATIEGPRPTEPAKPTEAPKPAAAPPTATTAPIKVDVSQPTATSAPAAAPAATQAPAAAPAAGKYKEAPQLADLVKAGKLPPVDQRLPQNPRVLKPLEEVGQYGGTWHRAYKGLSDRWGPTKLLEEFAIEWEAPDPNTIKVASNFYEKWEQNADASEYTFYLRKGIKWSDGGEVTTDDVKFWHEDIQLNKDLTPTPSFLLRQRVGNEFKLGTLTIADKYTFKLKYPAPYPLLPITIAKGDGGLHGMPGFIAPSRYLKQFHPKYAKQEDLDKLAVEKKLTGWTDLWGEAGDLQGPIPFWFLNPDLPVLNPWKIVKPAPADPMVMERNPFYWQVDTGGNQLPYVDRIEHALFDNAEVLKLWVASGKIDMQMRHMSAGAYTFYKENEKKANYRVFRWRAASTDSYWPNLNTPDKVLGKLFDTADFRQALNLAVNRSEINEVVWNGLGKPRQGSPVKGSPEYDADFEKTWAEYDPKKANELLDKLGLTKNADGTRNRPDGKPLEVTIEHTSEAGSPDNDAHGLVRKYWGAIGVKTTVKYLERGLYEERSHNGELEIGTWVLDGASVVKANPGIFLGLLDENSWAPLFGHWYANAPYKKEEPPVDHPIREVWKLWDQVQVEPDEAKRNALFQQLLGVHKRHPYSVGTVGEKVAPMIVANTFRNVVDGFVQDDTLRDSGLINPQQFFFKK